MSTGEKTETTAKPPTYWLLVTGNNNRTLFHVMSSSRGFIGVLTFVCWLVFVGAYVFRTTGRERADGKVDWELML